MASTVVCCGCALSAGRVEELRGAKHHESILLLYSLSITTVKLHGRFLRAAGAGTIGHISRRSIGSLWLKFVHMCSPGISIEKRGAHPRQDAELDRSR